MQYKPLIAVLRLCLRLAEAFAMLLFTGDVLPNKSSNRPSLGAGAAWLVESVVKRTCSGCN